MPDYDDSNIFARILRGELPAHKVYEDDQTIAREVEVDVAKVVLAGPLDHETVSHGANLSSREGRTRVLGR